MIVAKRNFEDGPEYSSTDSSWAEAWHEDVKFSKYERIKVKFPLIDDRKAVNLDYRSEDYARSYRGDLPGDGVDYANLSTRRPLTIMDAKYRYVNNAPNISNVPQGFYATESGIFPIDFVPFTQGPPSDNPNTITDFEDVSNSPSSEFIIANNTRTESQRPKNDYIYSYNPNVGRFEWLIKPEFDNPTEPKVRFPNGAIRKRKFK